MLLGPGRPLRSSPALVASAQLSQAADIGRAGPGPRVHTRGHSHPMPGPATLTRAASAEVSVSLANSTQSTGHRQESGTVTDNWSGYRELV